MVIAVLRFCGYAVSLLSARVHNGYAVLRMNSDNGVSVQVALILSAGEKVGGTRIREYPNRCGVLKRLG